MQSGAVKSIKVVGATSKIEVSFAGCLRDRNQPVLSVSIRVKYFCFVYLLLKLKGPNNLGPNGVLVFCQPFYFYSLNFH